MTNPARNGRLRPQRTPEYERYLLNAKRRETDLLRNNLVKTTALLQQASYATAHVERVRGTFRAVKVWHTNRTTWRVTCPADSELAMTLETWLFEKILANAGPGNQRLMTAKVASGSTRLFFADEARHKFNVGEHEVSFHIGDPNEKDRNDEAEAILSVVSKKMNKKDFIFAVRSVAARDALVDAFDEVIRKTMSKGVTNWLRYYESYGEWERGKILKPRSESSLVLADGQYERIMADIKRFGAERTRYETLGLPFHRGYLFYGPPGTGKTSLAHVLAANLKRDLYTLSLNTIDKDSKLHEAVRSVPSNAILLIEDVDIFSSTVTRTGDHESVSLHALLQVLDGLDTPDGLITILTTNHKDRLDPALTRAGRVDLAEEIGLPVYDQVAKLFKEIYGESMTRKLPAGAWSPTQTMSTYVEVFKRHLTDADAAIEQLVEVENTVNNTDELEKVANKEVEINASYNV